MEDREQLYTLLAQKDWDAIGKIIYKNKKAKKTRSIFDSSYDILRS
jgi:hypothetical protein